ncbi:MAG: efflux RND transporter periplasmic adaptor subunit [Bacteroidaceae bacterium]|nr:efflux RND transporter periplasmic adaptor subunit [Bacteroidaceae bacterium]MBR5276332.1 efflux RND transporter periplasmic adaptor subunit [Bacteroidaceae bacterium]
MNKYIKWGIVAIIVAVLAVLGIRTFTPKVNDEIKEKPVETKGKQSRDLNVKAVVLSATSISDEFFVSGSIIPDEEVNLSFETSGKITDIFFKEGTQVSKGDLLAKINDAPLQAELKKLESQLKLYTDRLYRQNALLEKEAVSQEAFQEAQTNLATLQAEIDKVVANIAQTELRAPFDGIIGLRQVSQGTYASPTTTIAKLTKTNPLKIDFAVPERYAGTLKNGTPLTFTVEGDLKEKSAKIYALDSHVNSDTRTFSVRALYDNSDGRLYPGRYVSVALTTQTFENTIAIPSQAIVSEMGIDKVFLYKSGKAIPAEIKKGVRTESMVQVLEGLSAGDTLITTGTMQLRTGQRVILDSVNE